MRAELERDADELFLLTLRQLESHIAGKVTRFDLLMVAAALRRLLLDGANSLVVLVNRRRQMKLRYRVNQQSAPPGARLWWVLDSIDPDIINSRDALPLHATLDQLLSRPVGLLRGVKITAKDLVLYFSNVAGGVHLGTPKSDKERTLAELDGRLADGEVALGKATPGVDPAISLEVDGLSGLLRSLRAVGRIVLRGLASLVQEVSRDV